VNAQELQELEKTAVEENLKCRQSFIYFLSFVHISDALKGDVKFELWPALLNAARAFAKHRLIVILKARQLGFSWLVAAFALWTGMFKRNANVLLLSQGEKEAVKLLDKCKYIYDHLPIYLQQKKATENTTELQFAGSGGFITALPSTPDAGRSAQATLVIGDEWAFHPYAEANYKASKPTIDAGGQFIGVSTPNVDDAESFMLKIFREALRGANNFHAIFEGFFSRPDRTEAQYDDLCREYNAADMRSEYPRTVDEALTPLEESLVFREWIGKLKGDVLLPRPSEKWLIYHKPVPEWRYVCGVDLAEGQGEDHDYSVATIIGRKGLNATVVAVIRTNTLRPDLFAREVYELCKDYYNPLLNCENNGLGIAFWQKMLELGYPRMYYKDETARKNRKPGITTTRQLKKVLCSDINFEMLSVPCKEMVEELCAFMYVTVEGPHGKAVVVEAPKGQHDDCVMSLGIANMILHKSSSGPMPVVKLRGSGVFAMR